MSKLAYGVVRVALEQLGQGEEDGNNKGWPVARYKRGRRALLGGSWCAAFASWCLEEASYGAGYKRSLVERSHGARKLYRLAGKAGAFISDPEPGCLVLWRRGKGWQGHIGIVEHVELTGFRTVEGNVGSFPARVMYLWHRNNEPDLIGFARLP